MTLTPKKYRQVRAPMGGGIRHPRVDKNTKKQELLEIVRPLFFPRGKNCHGKVEEFNFDISTDVRGTQLMLDDESVEDIGTRLGLKHFRCYVLALKRNDDDIDSLPDLQHEGDDDLMVVSVDIQKSKVQQATDIRSNTLDDGASPKSDPMKFDVCNQPVFVDYIAESPLLPWPLLGSTSQEDVLLVTNLQTPADNNVLDSGVAHSNLPLDNSVTDDTLPASLLPSQVPGGSCQEDLVSTTLFTEGLQTPCTSEQHMSSVAVETSKPQSDETLSEKNFPEVCQIIVHRGLVCRDFIDFFSRDNIEFNHSTLFEIKMLKEDGTPEAGEDSGGVMRDALTEFWDTFYLQYTEGNSHKVPVLRHEMTEMKWKAVAEVIKMGFIQERIFPIKLALSFMQQAIFGACIQSELIPTFLKFVSIMDKTVLERSLTDFGSVDQEDLIEVMDQFEAKKLISSDNIERVVREIAHKELVQKPMYVADCFFKILNNCPLVQEDLSVLYKNLEPSPKKVMKALKFPSDMTQEETTLCSFVKKLVREMDDQQYLQLFLRFCTGSDLLTNIEIHVLFTTSDVSNNVRCPSAHTCGCVLKIPRSYAQDPYVLLKSDFLSLLKNRYWQMDIV